MKIVIICSVRGGTPQEVYDYVSQLKLQGHKVYFPPDDTPQNDPIGLDICLRMKHQIQQADEIHIFYYPNSQGVHFDMGMAFAFGKKWQLVNDPVDTSEKSYIKVIKATNG